VKAVLVESFERIHRSNLVGMGVLPLQFLPGETAETHQLDGTETFAIDGLEPLNEGRTVPLVRVTATRANGENHVFDVRLRIDTPTEAQYYRHGGVLNFVLRDLASGVSPS
jgi:aconitate hydratase